MNPETTARGASASTTVDQLSAVIAQAIQMDVAGLQEAVGAIKVSTSDLVPQELLQGPADRSVYVNRTLTLLADRIPAGQAVEIFGAELARWVGTDNAEAVMGHAVEQRKVMNFVVAYEATGFTDDRALVDCEISEVEGLRISGVFAGSGKFPPGVLGVVRAYVSEDDNQDDSDIHVFIRVELLVEANSLKEAERISAPMDLLMAVSDELFAGQAIDLDGSTWEFAEANSATVDETSDPASKINSATSTAVLYESVWDEGTVSTFAALDLATGEVTDIEAVDDDGECLGCLQYEEISDLSRGVSAIVEVQENGRYFLKDLSMLAQFGGAAVEERKVATYTAGQNPEQTEHEVADEFYDLSMTMRSKATFGTETQTFRVWEGQSVTEVAERTASGYGAEVVEIRNPDGSLFVASTLAKVDDSPSPGM